MLYDEQVQLVTELNENKERLSKACRIS